MAFEFCIAHTQPHLDVAFDVPDQGIVGLFGPSGSGKTSVLRSMAGLLPEARVRMRYQSQQWEKLSVQQRPIAWMGQQPHLFPHWTVVENLHFALQQQKLAFSVCEVFLQALQCEQLLNRMPRQLSGGEYQRICLVRALALCQGNVQVLLLDEPLSAMNATLRRVALQLIAQHRDQLLVFFVSHQLQDMYCLCDHLLLMDEGGLKADGALGALMSSSRNDLSKAFHYVLDGKKFLIYAHEVVLSLRPVSDISVRYVITCNVTSVEPYGDHVLVYAKDQRGQSIISELTAQAVSELNVVTGLQVFVLFKSTGLIEVF